VRRDLKRIIESPETINFQTSIVQLLYEKPNIVLEY